MIYAIVNEFLGKVTSNNPEAEVSLRAVLEEESSPSREMHARLEEVFSPIFFHYPNGLKDRSFWKPRDTSEYIRQWNQFAADRLPVLQSTAAAAATEHDRDLSRDEVRQIFKTYMNDLKNDLRPEQQNKKWTYYKSCTESKLHSLAGNKIVAYAIWMIGLPALPPFATEQRGQRLSQQDLEAVPDAIHRVLNWLDRLAGALLTDRATSPFQEAQRKGGVTHGVSGLSATEQEARTAIRKAKYYIWKAKCLDSKYRAGTQSSFMNWEQKLLEDYWQGSLERRLQEAKSKYQGDTMHRHPLPP